MGYGDGDGTVNIESLPWCLRPAFATVAKNMDQLDHVAIIKDKGVSDDVKSVACADR